MNWQMVSAVAAIVVPVAIAVNAWFTSRIRADIAELKVQLSEQRIEEIEGLRDWVDREFVRRRETRAA
jgi:antibiotic biosynthesis monooxygenase (ABM) superfamily enzyme